MKEWPNERKGKEKTKERKKNKEKRTEGYRGEKDEGKIAGKLEDQTKEGKKNRICGLVGWLVGFYGISTIVGHLMPNPFYTYILNIWFLTHVVDTYLNEHELTFFKQFNGFTYFYEYE